MRGAQLISGAEAAAVLGITFVRFKVAIYRGLGRDHSRKPTGREPRPVSGGWSSRAAMYKASDIRRMHTEYNFRTSRNFEPDYNWLKVYPMAEYRPASLKAKEPLLKPVAPTPISAARSGKPQKPVLVEAAPAPKAARAKAAKPKAATRKAPPPKPAKKAPAAKAFKMVEIRPEPFSILSLI